MLKEILCPLFKHGKISFHRGLNIILGDDDAKNSIGKSTALMVIDFAHGGNSFLEDKAGVIRELGQHFYNFSFEFVGLTYFFSRSTDNPTKVCVCDKQYKRQSELSIDDYCKWLKESYGLLSLESSFRSIVNPYVRIWNKGGLEPDQPFNSVAKESAGVAISRLIDLLGRSADISAGKKIIDGQRAYKKLLSDSMNAEIIPKINKTQYKVNTRTIDANNLQIERLKQGFGGALIAYEALFDESLRQMQQNKNEVTNSKNELENKANRLRREISGITPRVVANIALVAEYFPTVDVKRLEQVEAFHYKMGVIVKKELKDELAAVQAEISALTNQIMSLEQQIQTALKSKGMPDDMFNRMFELKEITNKAFEENRYFERKKSLSDAIKISGQRLEDVYASIFLEIEGKINLKLKAFNKVVYGPTRNSSELRVRSANSFSFTSPKDTGTGKSYAGLIGFDMAMLSLTKLPFVVHDSVLYKNIEVAATKRILRILARVKEKQIFLSFDEAKKFGFQVERLIRNCTVLKLSHDDLLYNADWRDKK